MKIVPLISTVVMMILSTSKCSENQKLQDAPPFAIGEVYVESWTSPEVANTGFTLHIPIVGNDNSSIVLDSVYFRNQITKLVKESVGSNTVYIGKFEIPEKSNPDIIMSSDPLEEMKNKPPRIPKTIPYKLGQSEGIISYIVDGETRYFKIEDIIEKSN